MERATLAPDFWNDAENAQKIQKEHGQIQDTIKNWQTKWDDLEETEMLLEMAAEEGDREIEQEIAVKLDEFNELLAVTELECMFSGEHDTNNAIISIHAGAGGTEAQDWVDMMLRMYLRWAEIHGFKTEILDYLPGDEAGVKSVTVLIILIVVLIKL